MGAGPVPDVCAPRINMDRTHTHTRTSNSAVFSQHRKSLVDGVYIGAGEGAKEVAFTQFVCM